MGKKSKTVFFLPKLLLSLIFFGPSGVLVLSSKSGAFVPTVIGIFNSSLFLLVQLRLRLRSVYRVRLRVCQMLPQACDTVGGRSRQAAVAGRPGRQFSRCPAKAARTSPTCSSGFT